MKFRRSYKKKKMYTVLSGLTIEFSNETDIWVESIFAFIPGLYI